MSTMTELFKKRRQIRAAWDQKKLPTKELIYNLLKQTMDITPSKQNLFPYKVHAFGPNNPKEKHAIGQICTLYKTGSVNHWDDENKDGDFKSAAGELNIKDWVLDDEGNDMRVAPWVLVLEQRLAEPNNFVKEYSELHQDWSRFSQTDEKRFRGNCNTKLSCFEAGMFVQTLAGLCLENNLGISYIRSFPEWQWKGDHYTQDDNKHGANWDVLPEITEGPIVICQIGYVADIDDYFGSNSMNPNDIHWENKPDINTIVKFKD